MATTSCFRWIVTGGADGTVRTFDLGESLHGKQQKPPVTQGFLSSVTRGMVEIGSFENDDSVPVYPFTSDPEPAKPVEDAEEISKHWTNTRLSSVYSLAVEKEALWALTGLKSGNMRLWTVRHNPGTCLHLFKGIHKAPLSCIKLTDKEKSCVTGSWDKQIIKWDLNTGRALRSFSGHISQITSIDMHPTNPNVFLSTSFEGGSFIWDMRQAEPLRQLAPPDLNESPFCFYGCWNKSGNRIYCARRDHRVDEFSVDTGLATGNVLKLPPSSGSVAYLMPVDDSHLLCASQDNVRLWNINSRQASSHKIIPGHQDGQISSILMNDEYLVTASGNRGFGECGETKQFIAYQRIL